MREVGAAGRRWSWEMKVATSVSFPSFKLQQIIPTASWQQCVRGGRRGAVGVGVWEVGVCGEWVGVERGGTLGLPPSTQIAPLAQIEHTAS